MKSPKRRTVPCLLPCKPFCSRGNAISIASGRQGLQTGRTDVGPLGPPDSWSVGAPPMSELTRVAIGRGDPHAAVKLLPLVYQELRQLAVQKLAQGVGPAAGMGSLGQQGFFDGEPDFPLPWPLFAGLWKRRPPKRTRP